MCFTVQPLHFHKYLTPETQPAWGYHSEDSENLDHGIDKHSTYENTPPHANRTHVRVRVMALQERVLEPILLWGCTVLLAQLPGGHPAAIPLQNLPRTAQALCCLPALTADSNSAMIIFPLDGSQHPVTFLLCSMSSVVLWPPLHIC